MKKSHLIGVLLTMALMLSGVSHVLAESPPEEPKEELLPIEELIPKEIEPEEDEDPFLDVTQGASAFYVPIDFLQKQGIIRGYSDGTFRPNQLVNRVEALSIIFNGAKNLPSEQLQEVQQFTLPIDTIINLNFPTETDITLQTPGMETPLTLERTGVLEVILPQGGILRSGRIYVDQLPNFTDVPPSEWYFSLVRRGLSLDVVQGYPDGTFRPTNSTNLVEALAMILRINRIVLTPPDDVDMPEDIEEDTWFYEHVGYGIARSIISPTSDNMIAPEKQMTRGELAAMMYRFLRTQDGFEFGKSSWYGDGLSVIEPDQHHDKFEAFLTAAHKTLPFGTLVRVTNIKNGKQVDVVINDRGPFVPGRIIDLSKSAFAELATPTVGVINVEVEILKKP
jgi:rare lipoprotein A